MSQEAVIAEADIPRPKVEQEAIDHYQTLTDLIEMLGAVGETEWAEAKQIAGPGLPKQASNRQLRGQADANNYCAGLEEISQKKTAECQ